MTKKEVLWREILHQAVNNKKFEFTQKELALEFGFSLSTIFNALKIPRQTGAVKVTGHNFVVQDIEKFLCLWATQRNLAREIIYAANSPQSPQQIEGAMPSGIIFAAYSAFVKKYNSAPADYGKVYIYANKDELSEIKKRFPKTKGEPNLFVLKKDLYLKNFGETTPDVQIFADLWNLSDWYAKDFLNALKEKIGLI